MNIKSNLLRNLGALAALTASAASLSAAVINFDFTNGNNTSVNSKSYTVSGLTVTVTASSYKGGGNWDSGAKVGLWDPGLGVNNSGNDDSHTVDSSGWVDYLIFKFSPLPADVTGLSIGWVQSDSDFRYWFNNTGTLSATGGTAVNGYTYPYAGYSIDMSGPFSYFIVAADYQNTSNPGNDANFFKISGLSVTTNPTNTPGVPDGGSTIALLGVGLMGLAALRRRLD